MFIKEISQDVSLSRFAMSVMLASLIELGSVPSLSILWKGLRVLVLVLF
jgi:hypothetical protein